MDRRRNITTRNGPTRKNQRNPRTNRIAMLDRRNRRQGLNRNRNRLFRVQNNIRRTNNNQRNPNRNRRRINNFRFRPNLNNRIIYVANIPYQINSRTLRNLFIKEGRINRAYVVFGRNGSKGYGFVEFNNPRDAWRSIQKWNNTILNGRNIIVKFRNRRRFTNRGGNNHNNNHQRFNQPRPQRGFGRGFRGGFRPRGGRYY